MVMPFWCGMLQLLFVPCDISAEIDHGSFMEILFEKKRASAFTTDSGRSQVLKCNAPEIMIFLK